MAEPDMNQPVMVLPTTPQTGPVSEYSGSPPDPPPYASSSGSTTIYRCPTGYVIDDSWKFTTNQQDVASLTWSEDSYLTTSGEVPNPTFDFDFRCIPENCDPGSFIDSEQEFDVLMGTITSDPQTIRCNEGYVFDHHRKRRSGEVKCDYVPKEIDEPITTKHTMAWYVHDQRLEDLCATNSGTDQETCESTIDPHPPSTSLDIEGEDTDQLAGCHWQQGYTDADGFVIEDQCLFRKRADLNQDNPICQPMLCPRKEIPNSNRIGSRDGPLPGPHDGNIHGSCIDDNGESLDHITHSSDCNCYKHKTCSTCTESDDCQWCPVANDGSGDGTGFCYSVHTYHQICEDNSFRHSRGGTCTHALTGESRELPEGVDEWTRETCEINSCSNQRLWTQGVAEPPVISLNGETYDRFELTSDDCFYLNNRWDEHGRHNYEDTCIFENNEYQDLFNTGNTFDYYPILDSNTISLNTSEYICVPQEGSESITNNGLCNEHITVSDCESDVTCQFIENPLRNSLIQWNSLENLHVNFQGPETGGQCPILPQDNGYEVVSGDNNLRTLSGASINIDVDDSYDLSECAIQLNGIDTFNSDHCPGEKITEVYCRDGIAFCPGDMNVTVDIADCDSDNIVRENGVDVCRACPVEDTIMINGETIFGCEYNITQTDTGGYCYGSMVEPECSLPQDTSPYTCINPDLVGSEPGNSSLCLTTGYAFTQYQSKDEFMIPQSAQYQISEFKNNGVCSLVTNETDCDKIGRDNAHYGRMCSLPKLDSEGTEIEDEFFYLPMKQICIASGNRWVYQNSEWECVDNDTMGELDDMDICNLLNTTTTYIKPHGVEYDNSAPSGTPLALIDVSSTDWRPTTDNQCILDTSVVNTDNAEQLLTDLCESYENHSIGFVYSDSDNLDDFTPVCQANDPTRQESTDLIRDQQTCEGENRIYVQEYNYVDTASCQSLDPQPPQRPDESTVWTGGEITTEGDIHVSECSPSIMSSCNVECDAGYGGGGEYICHYNSDNGEQCGSIIDENECISYPSCQYVEGVCSHDDTSDNEGHLEWLGSECYLIDNTAFSHGMAPLPQLNELFPPVLRVIVAFVFIGLLIAIVGYVLVKPALKLTGNVLSSKAKSIGNSIKTSISSMGPSKGLVGSIASIRPTPAFFKQLGLGIIGLVVLLFVLPTLFGAMKDTVKSTVTSLTDGISDVIYDITTLEEKVDESVQNERNRLIEEIWSSLDTINYRSLSEDEISQLQDSLVSGFLRDNMTFPLHLNESDQITVDNYIEQQQLVGTIGTNFTFEISERQLFTAFINSVAQVWNQ